MIATLAQNWWVLAVRGVAALLFGIGAFIWPGLTLTSLVLLFGAYALVDGIFAISDGIRSRGQQERWWILLVGLASILAGVLTLLWPGITTLILLYVIAARSIATGIFEVAAAIRLRKERAGEWLLTLPGIASVLFGILLVCLPGTGALALLWLIGSYALVYSILLLVLAVRLRSLRATIARRPVEAM